MKKILLTGGGSGGHIYPLLAVAEYLKSLTAESGASRAEISYLGPAHPLNEEFKKLDIKTYKLFSSKFRRYFSFLNLLDVPKFFLSFFQALWRLYFLMPDVVFSKGGPGAFAVVLAARFYFIPVMIHESDAIPGLTNRLSSSFAKRIGVSFKNAVDFFPVSKTILVGNPVRKELSSGFVETREAKEKLGFNPREPLILILGGSQGAQTMNNFVFDNLEELLKVAQICHQVGEANFEKSQETVSAISREPGLTARNRCKTIGNFNAQELKIGMSAADLIISRAGAGAIFEIAAFGKPSILIPLDGSANNHQKINAYEYAETNSLPDGQGAAVVIEEANFKTNIVLVQIKKILSNESLRQEMFEAAKKFARVNAAEIIAKEILILANKPR